MNPAAAGLRYSWHSGPLRPLVLASIASLLGMAAIGQSGTGPMCMAERCTGLQPIVASLTGLRALAAWLLMTGAMMLPLLVLQVGHAWRSSFERDRLSSV